MGCCAGRIPPRSLGRCWCGLPSGSDDAAESRTDQPAHPPHHACHRGVTEGVGVGCCAGRMTPQSHGRTSLRTLRTTLATAESRTVLVGAAVWTGSHRGVTEGVRVGGRAGRMTPQSHGRNQPAHPPHHACHRGVTDGPASAPSAPRMPPRSHGRTQSARPSIRPARALPSAGQRLQHGPPPGPARVLGTGCEVGDGDGRHHLVGAPGLPRHPRGRGSRPPRTGPCRWGRRSRSTDRTAARGCGPRRTAESASSGSPGPAVEKSTASTSCAS